MLSELETIPFDLPEPFLTDPAASGEQLDAVDDNLQEPPSVNDDHDDDSNPAVAESA